MNNLAFKVAAGQKNLRLACDLCHQGKVKCSGGTPCEGCRKLGVRCKYSTSNRTGRPKGVKNKKTLDRIKQLRADDASEHEHEETRVAGNKASPTPINRRPSVSQGLLNAQADQISLPTPPSLPDNSHSQGDSNLSSIADNSPESSWGYFPVSRPENCLDTDHPPSITAAKGPSSCHIFCGQGPCVSNYQSSDSFGLLHSGDIPGYLLPELSGDDTLFTQTDLTPGSGDMDYTLKSPHVSHQIQNSEPARGLPSQPQIRPPSACNCVRQITEKLASFKALSVYPQRFQPDFVLTVARDSLMGWRPYLQCPSCQQSDDKDILVLSVMALRALLNLIQEIGLRRKYQPQREETEEEAPTESASSAPFLDSQNSFLGTYRLACEEKRLVVDLLLYRTLKSLDRTAKNLREKSLTMARTPSKSDSESNQSSRSYSSPSPPDASPTVYYGLPDMLARSGRTDRLDSTGFSVSPDEHDNYLQKSLQSLTSHIESLLLTIQNPHTCQGQDDADTFGL